MLKLKIGLAIIVMLAICGMLPSAVGRPGAPPTVSPQMQEIQTVLAQERIAILALQEALEAAPSERDALEILRAIGQRKQDTEIAVLRIQEQHARQAGDEAAATRIEQAIHKILNPEPLTISPEARLEMEARRAGGQDHE